MPTPSYATLWTKTFSIQNFSARMLCVKLIWASTEKISSAAIFVTLSTTSLSYVASFMTTMTSPPWLPRQSPSRNRNIKLCRPLLFLDQLLDVLHDQLVKHLLLDVLHDHLVTHPLLDVLHDHLVKHLLLPILDVLHEL